MVKRQNANVTAWENKTISPSNVQDYARGTRVRDDALVRSLAAALTDGQWPPYVRADVNRLIREINRGRPYLNAVATAKSDDEAWAAWQRVPGFEPQGAAAADVRTKLGLPPYRD